MSDEIEIEDSDLTVSEEPEYDCVPLGYLDNFGCNIMEPLGDICPLGDFEFNNMNPIDYRQLLTYSKLTEIWDP